jgi:hypothetical protein
MVIKTYHSQNQGKNYLIALNGDADGEEACDGLAPLKPTIH